MMVVPINPEINEAERIGEKNREQRPSALISGSCGTFSSSTMMVMMMAKTPSLNASSRFVFMRGV